MNKNKSQWQSISKVFGFIVSKVNVAACSQRKAVLLRKTRFLPIKKYHSAVPGVETAVEEVDDARSLLLSIFNGLISAGCISGGDF